MRLIGWAAVLVVGGIASMAGLDGADDGEVTVTTPTKTGAAKETRVQLKTVDGESWSCPLGTGTKLEPLKARLGRLELNLRSVRRDVRTKVRRLDAMEERYPGNAPTQAIADKYNRLVSQAKRLDAREGRSVVAYNRAVDRHNAVIEADCTS